MSLARILAIVVTAIIASPLLVTAGGDDAKPIVVDLSTFEFKVPKDKAELFSYVAGAEKLQYYANGLAEAKVNVPKDGDYDIIVKASGDIALKVGAKFKVAVDGKMVGKETETDGGEKDYKLTTPLKAGERKLSIEFTNDVYKQDEYDRNLFVHGVTLKKAK